MSGFRPIVTESSRLGLLLEPLIGEIQVIDICGSEGRALETVAPRVTRRAKELRVSALTAVMNDSGVAHAQGNIHLQISLRISQRDVDWF